MSLPNTIHISWQNALAAYTLAADVAVETAYPLTNCQNQHRSEWTVFDMTGETTVAITGSSATDRAANCFSIHNHDAPTGTTLRLRLYAGESQTGTVVYDSNDYNDGDHEIRNKIPLGSSISGIDPFASEFETDSQLTPNYSLWFDPVWYKSFQIDITNAAGFTNNVLKVDKLWLGYAYGADHGIEHGWESNLLDDSEHIRKPGGGMETVEGVVRRSLRLEWDAAALDNAERHTLRHLLDRAKMSGDLLVTLDPNDARSQRYETTSIYRRKSPVSFISQFWNGNGFGLDLEEN